MKQSGYHARIMEGRRAHRANMRRIYFFLRRSREDALPDDTLAPRVNLEEFYYDKNYQVVRVVSVKRPSSWSRREPRIIFHARDGIQQVLKESDFLKTYPTRL